MRKIELLFLALFIIFWNWYLLTKNTKSFLMVPKSKPHSLWGKGFLKTLTDTKRVHFIPLISKEIHFPNLNNLFKGHFLAKLIKFIPIILLTQINIKPPFWIDLPLLLAWTFSTSCFLILFSAQHFRCPKFFSDMIIFTCLSKSNLQRNIYKTDFGRGLYREWETKWKIFQSLSILLRRFEPENNADFSSEVLHFGNIKDCLILYF